jgi:hypothetical protein
MAEPRLLFLLSNDYGELSNALYLLRGSQLDATLLLPERLFEANAGSAGIAAQRYRTMEDVLGALDRARPDLVLLFSAYLYAINGILEVSQLEALLFELARRRIAVATSDPFLGLAAATGVSPFSERHPQQRWLTQHFEQVSDLLRDVTHVYLVPAGGLAPPRKASFFNPLGFGNPLATEQRSARLVERMGADATRRRWLFVLAAEDYGAQVARLGRENFEALLWQRLQDAAHAGCQPVLIAPPPCAETLARSAQAVPGLLLTSFCGHDVFTDLLLEAEYAFYWNVLSNSLLARMATGAPVLFFDRGHLAQAMPPLLELGLKTYFPGAQLALLDQRQPLTTETLERLAAQQVRTLADAIGNLKRSPTPRQLVDRLLIETAAASGSTAR